MCLSVFLAQTIGCYLFAVGLAMIIFQQRFKKLFTDCLSHSTMIAAHSTVSLILGLLIVVSHNIWIDQWPVVVTVFGWLLLVMGLFTLFFPESYVKMAKDSVEKTPYMVLSWARLLVGLYLIWAGFSQG